MTLGAAQLQHKSLPAQDIQLIRVGQWSHLLTPQALHLKHCRTHRDRQGSSLSTEAKKVPACAGQPADQGWAVVAPGDAGGAARQPAAPAHQ